jgi:hypothetical protein
MTLGEDDLTGMGLQLFNQCTKHICVPPKKNIFSGSILPFIILCGCAVFNRKRKNTQQKTEKSQSAMGGFCPKDAAPAGKGGLFPLRPCPLNGGGGEKVLDWTGEVGYDTNGNKLLPADFVRKFFRRIEKKGAFYERNAEKPGGNRGGDHRPQNRPEANN